ncbi:relaxase/mobilization nuclease domain-containing protein [Chitinophaga sp.]|uniref:relaxase/mobilization nuclease domain-containing protein n=1 Tax=Chitinophaga sp. TaxID=1869181 RepID=UPI0031E2A811
MISKVITGKTFYGCCRYVCKDERRTQLLHSEDVRDYNPRVMAFDFEQTRQLVPNKKKAVFHGILSFHPEDKVTDRLMLDIAKAYLRQIGLVNTQLVIVKHTEKAHPHLHIIANLVNHDGVVISDSWIGLRGKKAAQALTRQYRLIEATRKDLTKTNLQALNEEEATRYEIFQAITAALPQSSRFSELEALLLKQGIDILYKKKQTTGEIQGISYRKGKYAFKGSSIDRSFSFAGIQKAILHKHHIRPRIMQPIKRRRGLGL